MGKNLLLLGVVFIALMLFVSNGDAIRKNGLCSWMTYDNSSCLKYNYLCSNGKCINRNQYCDGRDDCGDMSDENSCNTRRCDDRKLMCPGGYKCIPVEWNCDGIIDCNNGKDEENCEKSKSVEVAAMIHGLQWLKKQKNTQSATEAWGSYVERIAVTLYLADMSKNLTKESKELAYEVSIQLLSLLSKKKLQEIPSTDLASYLNALLVTCMNPRKFYGFDIVQELRDRVDRQNYTNPYLLLSLCNAGVTITDSDKMKLIDVFWARHRAFWTDIQAGALMALACANKQPENDVDSETLRELAAELKQHQYRNGTVENLQTTALVLQALFATEPNSDPDNFDDVKAMKQIIAMQKKDGSFGNFLNTYYALPVLNCMSLVNISSDHCESYQKDEMSAIDDLINRSGPKLRVHYFIWIGNDKDLEWKMALRVPANVSFYSVMEMAADIDSRYRFEYVVKNRKPYINALAGLQDDPEKSKFWFLYKVEDGRAIPSQQSPADVRPKENEHFVMWYRSGTWIE